LHVQFLLFGKFLDKAEAKKRRPAADGTPASGRLRPHVKPQAKVVLRLIQFLNSEAASLLRRRSKLLFQNLTIHSNLFFLYFQ
jgi:hypothetical protein